MIRAVLCGLAGVLATLVSIAPAWADPIRDAQWHLDYLNVSQAHQLSQGNGVLVAVIDTGVDARHPDLRGNVRSGTDFTTDGQGGDGRADIDGHGTAMSGLIAAHGRTLGIAPKSEILPVRIIPSRFGLTGHLSEGVEWAIQHGAQVLCIAGSSYDHSDLRNAIERALSHNVVVVAGVGNVPTDIGVGAPAKYRGVVAAAGVDKKGNHAAVSAEGPEVVLAAPAVDIMSIDIRGPGHTGYGTSSGTSDATAILAGAAALVRARFPDLSAAEVVHRLTATADDKGLPGHDHQYGYGVVDLVRALTADVPSLLTSEPPPSGPTPRAAPPSQPIDIPWLLVISALALTIALTILVVAYLRTRTSSGVAK
jgi:type VII secretion-associated serine protease mycosin